MSVDLFIVKGGGGEWVFRVTCDNCADGLLTLRLDVIKRNGARIGLHFFLSGKEIEPVDMVLISPRHVANEVDIPSGSKISVDFVGNAERKAVNAYALIFAGVTYHVVPESAYMVQFIWHDMRSNVLDWKIS